MAVLAARKTLRIAATLFPLIYYFNNKITALLVILPFLCFFIAIEVLRFCIFKFNERLFGTFGYILKEKEKKGVLGITLFVLSVFLSIILFRKDIAIAAILFLIFGDTASGIVGSRFGRRQIFGRSLQGSLAFFITCLIIGITLNFTNIGLPWAVVVLGALSATIIELLPLPIDDNFTIALFSGIIMTLVAK